MNILYLLLSADFLLFLLVILFIAYFNRAKTRFSSNSVVSRDLKKIKEQIL